VTLAAFVVAVSTPAVAQVADHLQCYKVKDVQPKATYTADLNGLAAQAGRLIEVPAALVCVPTTKTNVTPAPPGGGRIGAAAPFGCYEVECPKTTLPTVGLDDQFGNRTVTPQARKLVCAPAEAASGGRRARPRAAQDAAS
jgi:hypothetical protein